MNRRLFLSLTACAPLAPHLPWSRDYARCLPDHLRDMAARARGVRERALAELVTPDSIRRRQAWVTDTLWRVIGGRPAPAPPTTYSPRYLASGREEVARLRRVYATLGRPDHLRWVESAEPHALTGARRGEIERWLARFLLGESARGAEPAVAPEPEPATWVVPGGNVRAIGGRTPRELASEEVAARGAGTPALLEVARPAAGLSASELGRAPAKGGAVAAIEVRSAPSVWVPAWLFEPPGARGTVVIALDPRGRGARWEDSVWAGHGDAVCAADVRGTGSLAVAGDEHAFAWAALILGESLLAQRVADILALVTALSNHPRVGGRPLVLAARGALTAPALLAAALEPRVSAVHLDGGLASFASVLSAPEGRCPLAWIVPGMAAHADLPEVAAAVGPRRVIVSGPVDGAGRLLGLEEARAIYRGAPNVTVAATGRAR